MTAPIVRCSSLPRIQQCPASWAREQGIPDLNRDDAAAGTRLHAVLADYWLTPPAARVRPDLADPFEHSVVNAAIDFADIRIAKFLGERRVAVEVEVERELAGVLLRGHIDLAVYCGDGKTALIFEWKTGRLEQKPAWDHEQLLAYAALFLTANEHVKECRAYIVPAEGEPTGTVVSRDMLPPILAKFHTTLTFARARDPEVNPHPDACRYCRARGNLEVCPESVEGAKDALVQVQPVTQAIPAQKVDAAAVESAYSLLSEAITTFERMKDWMRDKLREDPNAFEGLFVLKETRGKAKVERPQVAYERLVGSKLVTHEAFMASVSISVPALSEAAAPEFKARKVKAKDIRPAIEEALGDCLGDATPVVRLERGERAKPSLQA